MKKNKESSQHNEKEELLEEPQEQQKAPLENTASEEIQSPSLNTALQEELNKQKELFLRIAAEYENYRKRTEKDKLNIYQDATASAILTILPLADSLERAVETKDGSVEDYKKGLEMVHQQLNSCLEKLGVEEFGTVGEQFSPDIHNAIAHIEDENLELNTITEVFQGGYRIGEKIIRHAMVKVAN